uniref:Uncharacterized protein n=1 Tax=Pseudomonas marincola TaxID=437900 RepID=A0A653E3M4_9PSED
MDGAADVNPEVMISHAAKLEDQWITEHGQRAKQHNSGDSYSHVLLFGFNHRLTGKNCSRAANCATRRYQDGQLAGQLEQFYPQPGPYQQNAGGDHDVQDNSLPTDLYDLLKAEAEAKQNNPGAQQALLAEPGECLFPCSWRLLIEVAIDNAEQNGQWQGAEPQMGNRWDLREKQRSDCDQWQCYQSTHSYSQG